MSLWFRRAVIWLFLLLPFLPSIIVMSLHFDPNQAECYGIVSLILHSIQSSFNRTSTYQPYIDVSCSSSDGTDVPGLDVESAFDDVGEERISLHNSGKSELSYSPPGNSFSFTPVPSPVNSTRKDSNNQSSYLSRGSASTSSNSTPSVNHDVSTKVLQNSYKLFTIPAEVPFRPSKSVLSRFNRISGVHPSLMQSPSNTTRIISASKYLYTSRVSRSVTPSSRIQDSRNTSIPLATRVSPSIPSSSILITHASSQSSPSPSHHSSPSPTPLHSSPSPSSHHSLPTTPRKPKRSRKTSQPTSFPPIIPCSNIQFYDWGDSIGMHSPSLPPRLPRTMRHDSKNSIFPIR